MLRGEGVGPEVVDVALELLDVVAETLDLTFDVREGGPIGVPAIRASGRALTAEVSAFCEDVFSDRGALLCGPGGGRFVYELRRHFDLYTKLTPIEPSPALGTLGPLRPEAREGVRMVIVRENTGGVYQGDWTPATRSEDEATHRFGYTRTQTERILRVAFGLSRKRTKRLAVVTKPGGVPSVSALWKEATASLEPEYGIDVEHLEVDNAAYQLIARAQAFDVVVAPNLFGDILGDAASLLLGSRGMSYSGNFGASGSRGLPDGPRCGARPGGPGPRESVGPGLLARHDAEGELRSRPSVGGNPRRGGERPEPWSGHSGSRARRHADRRHARAGAAGCARARDRTRPQGDDTMSIAYVLLDLQQDFLARPGLVPSARQVVEAAGHLLAHARREEFTIVHARTVVEPDGRNAMPHWQDTAWMPCRRGTPGCAPPAALREMSGERVIEKQHYSAFSDPALDAHLREHGVSTLVLLGLYTHACIRATALDAYARDTRSSWPTRRPVRPSPRTRRSPASGSVRAASPPCRART